VSHNFKVVVTGQVFPGIDTKTLTGGQPGYPVRPWSSPAPPMRKDGSA
jgi:hypothetical protein